MGFKRFVELGRVALINYGEDYGKLCVIVEIVNPNRVLIDGPTLGTPRQVITFRRISLTDFVVPKVMKGLKTSKLEKLIKEFDLIKKWEQTSWAKKIAIQARRAHLTDLDRFKVMVLQKQKSYILNAATHALKEKAKGKKK